MLQLVNALGTRALCQEPLMMTLYAVCVVGLCRLEFGSSAKREGYSLLGLCTGVRPLSSSEIIKHVFYVT